MIPVSTTISKNGYATPMRNQVFGDFTEQQGIGDPLNGLMSDPRPEKMSGGLSGLELIGDVYDIANQNAPCIRNDELGAMIRTRTKGLDNVLSTDGMAVQPNPASRLKHFGLSHMKCDIANSGLDNRLRKPNMYNPMLPLPFKKAVN